MGWVPNGIGGGKRSGKRILRLRVIDEQGLQLRFSQIVVRNSFRFVDSLPAFYLVGRVTSLVSRRAQHVDDISANTIVPHRVSAERLCLFCGFSQMSVPDRGPPPL